MSDTVLLNVAATFHGYATIEIPADIPQTDWPEYAKNHDLIDQATWDIEETSLHDPRVTSTENEQGYILSTETVDLEGAPPSAILNDLEDLLDVARETLVKRSASLDSTQCYMLIGALKAAIGGDQSLFDDWLRSI